MAPERKLWHDLKKNTCSILFNRIENLSGIGLPDVLGYNTSGNYFTVELKVAQGNKVKFSPHQIAFHKTHPKHSFILLRVASQSTLKLVPGSEIHELSTKGHKKIFSIADTWTGIQEAFEQVL
jgi:Holliday junction resolvase